MEVKKTSDEWQKWISRVRAEVEKFLSDEADMNESLREACLDVTRDDLRLVLDCSDPYREARIALLRVIKNLFRMVFDSGFREQKKVFKEAHQLLEKMPKSVFDSNDSQEFGDCAGLPN